VPSALILFAHGSRDPGWSQPFERLVALIRKAAPEKDVRVAYLEVMEPDLSAAAAAAVASGASSIRIVPIFLASGGHIRRDLSALAEQLRARYPGVSIECSKPAGEDDAVLGALAQYCLR
jgi:sirohydrochlorin cobaltochelatase